MEIARIPLVEGYRRPTIMYKGLDALFDTGAEICVWNLPRQTFELVMDVKSCGTRDVIKGFGGECEGTLAIAWKVEIEGLIFKEVPFFIPDRQFAENKIIIAGTLFKDYVYSVDMVKHIMIVKESE